VPEWSGLTPIVTRRFVSAAHRAGVAVKVWTVNAETDMRRLVSIGVDALITDHPDVARSVISSWPAERRPVC
jgi:glycerophosphoryl diester phosphodiesterase